MINTILTEANQVVNSLEHYNTLKSIGNTFLLDDESFGALSSVTNSVIMGIFSETEFVTHLIDSSGLDTKKAESIFGQVKNKILNPFKLKVKDIVSNNQVKTTGVLDDSNINTLRKSAPLPQPSFVEPAQPSQPQHTQPVTDQNPTKASLLSEIESPQRTVIKKYVIEHEPITDPEHIIDDKIDTRPRLEQ